MGISVVLTRFAIGYLAMALACAVVFKLMKLGSNSGATVGVLAAGVMWACSAFAKSNGRYFTSQEKWRVVAGMLLLHLVFQLAFALPLLAVLKNLPVGMMLGGAAFLGVMHGIVIYVFVAITGRFLVKQYIDAPHGDAS